MSRISNPFTVSILAQPTGETALEQVVYGTGQSYTTPMVAGEWRTVPQGPTFTDYLFMGNEPNILNGTMDNTDKCVRNPNTKKVWFYGGARPYRNGDSLSPDTGFIEYDEVTNSWSGTGSGVAAPFYAPVSSNPHAYNHSTMNWSNGDWYYMEASDLTTPDFWRRSFATGLFTSLQYPSSYFGAYCGIEYFPERNGIVLVDGGRGYVSNVRFFSFATNTWTQRVDLPTFIGQFSNFIHYSAAKQLMYFGGGDATSTGGDVYGSRAGCAKHFFTMDAAGNVSAQLAEPPDPVTLIIGGQKQSVDPVTGNLLWFQGGQPAGLGRIWSYDPSANSWTQHGFHPMGLFGGTDTTSVSCQVPEYGVVLFICRVPRSLFVYKHSNAASYHTTFGSTENTISEGGKWVNGQADGSSWSDVQTTSGRAIGSRYVDDGVVSRYADSIAHIKTSFKTFSADQFIQGTVYREAGYIPTNKHEIELLVRWSISGGVARGYEVLWTSNSGDNGRIVVVRWNGSLGSFDEVPGGNYMGTPAVDGDILRVEVRGSSLTVKRNGVAVLSNINLNFGGSYWSSGQPGIGFWPVYTSDGNVDRTKYGWKEIFAGNL